MFATFEYIFWHSNLILQCFLFKTSKPVHVKYCFPKFLNTCLIWGYHSCGHNDLWYILGIVTICLQLCLIILAFLVINEASIKKNLMVNLILVCHLYQVTSISVRKLSWYSWDNMNNYFCKKGASHNKTLAFNKIIIQNGRYSNLYKHNISVYLVAIS